MIRNATCSALLLTMVLTAWISSAPAHGAEVPLPAEIPRVEEPKQRQSVITVRADGTMYVGGKKVSEKDLSAFVKTNATRRFLIRPAQGVRWQSVVDVFSLATRSGAKYVGFDRSTPDSIEEGGATVAKAAYTHKSTDTSVSLVKGEKVIWKFNFDEKEGKPYFHPLCTSDGTLLTALRPKDHPWHRALWFSWKHINGLNYWEENRQGLSEGLTEIKTVKILTKEGQPAKIDMTLSYHPPEKPVVMTEKLSIVVSLPDAAGVYTITWKTVFTAGEKDVVLDRTPIPGEKGGKGYGGYAGLSLRLAAEQKKWPAVDSEGRKDMKIHGQAARWMGFGDKIGGGGVFIEAGKSSFDATPQWYISKGMPYFSPAVLFAKPFTLKAGKSIDMAYIITIYPKKATAPGKAPV